MIILIDMDDTIENLGLAWTKYLNKKYNQDVDWYRDVTQWDMKITYPELTPEQIYGALNDEELWDSVTVKDDAPYYVKKLMEEGNKVYIVTASWYSTLKAKVEKCLFKYFPFISWDQVIVTTDKHLIKGDILLDDNPENLVNGDYFGILFTAPHNLNYDDSESDMIRVDNWKSAYLIIKGYEETLNNLGGQND